MHLSDCLHPKLIVNPYTHERQYVPCGHCDACRNRRANSWVQRLEIERMSWKYCVFFTLTYDEQNVPLVNKCNDVLYFKDSKHTRPSDGNVFISKTDLELGEKHEFDWYNKQSFFRVLSSYDVQCFVKRFRINNQRLFNKLTKRDGYIEEKAIQQVRYYICGEYGETTYRPHYHGLFFFSSEYTAAHFAELLSKSWRFGRVDYSFVSSCNASYVARYVNCINHLPKVLRFRYWRPFAVFSKHPPLGTLCTKSAEVEQIFYSAACDFIIFDPKKQSLCSVPLWRSFKDRLFPKLSRFDEIPFGYRAQLYRAAEKIESFQEFDVWIWKRNLHSAFFNEYVDRITDNGKLDSPIYRWYSISRRVVVNAASFGVSVDFYVKQISLFYDNLNATKLKMQLDFESKYIDDYGLDGRLAYIDPLFMFDVSLMPALSVSDVDDYILHTLDSFGIDVNAFFDIDLSARQAYRDSLVLSQSREFSTYKLNQNLIAVHNRKTKRKNDYLFAHPELSSLNYLT